MRTYKEAVSIMEVEDTITCDFCGAVISHDQGVPDFQGDEITVSRNVSVSYPEGGYGTKWEVDMCPKCWDTKLVPWIRSQGVEIVGRRYDW